jgi:hypothetical protein
MRGQAWKNEGSGLEDGKIDVCSCKLSTVLKPRIHLTGSFYHIILRGNGGQGSTRGTCGNKKSAPIIRFRGTRHFGEATEPV